MICAQVTVAIKDIEEGSHVRSFELKDPKDASRTMATLKVSPFRDVRLSISAS